MTGRVRVAVTKASGARLLADMVTAARIVEQATLPGHPRVWSRAFVFGALEVEASLTVRACLLTAFGG